MFLHLRLSVKLHKQFLNYLNIIYNIAKIKKLGYKELNIFILSIGSLSTISKSMIFVDRSNKKMALIKYLGIKPLIIYKIREIK